MEKKVVYVREHFSKEVRQSIVELARQRETEGQEKRVNGYQFKRKKQRVWTLNRSPHGNKTAREQFGRQVWQRRRERSGNKVNGTSVASDAKQEWRKKVVYGKHEYVRRKEIQTIGNEG
jgi:hypothetical protein